LGEGELGCRRTGGTAGDEDVEAEEAHLFNFESVLFGVIDAKAGTIGKIPGKFWVWAGLLVLCGSFGLNAYKLRLESP
jgi:hypothetical protein